jgi:hypothetical protein
MAKKGRAVPDREKDAKEQKHIPSSSSSSSSALLDSSAMDRDIKAEEFLRERPSAETTEGQMKNGANASETASETCGRIGPREENSLEKDMGVGTLSEVQRKEGAQSEGAGPSSPAKTISLSLPVTLSPTAAAAAAAAELNGQKEESQDCKGAETDSQTGQDAKMENVKEESEAEGQPAVVTCIRATESSMPTITCNVRTANPFSFLFFSHLQYSCSPIMTALLLSECSKPVLAAVHSSRCLSCFATFPHSQITTIPHPPIYFPSAFHYGLSPPPSM